MASLRRRIGVGVVGITSGVVLVAAVGIRFASQAVLVGDVDRELEERSERIRRLDALPRPPDAQRRRLPADPRLDGRRVWQVFALSDGRELARSSSLEAGADLRSPAAALDAPRTIVLGDGRAVRLLALRTANLPPFAESAQDAAEPALPAVAAPAAPRFLVITGIDLAQVEGELGRMTWMLATLWVAATGLALVAVRFLAGAIMQPVHAVGMAIDRIGPDDLAARLAVPGCPEEVLGMVERLNGLLSRLEQAFQREQATIANIAHELRTPVATLRSEIEFRLLATRDPDEIAVLRGNLTTVQRMQAMVTNLLLLARLEAEREPLEVVETDVVELIQTCIASWDDRTLARGQDIVVAAPDRLALRTSPVHLRLIIDNLLGNAVAHGTTGGEIRLAVSPQDGKVRLTLANPCTADLDAGRLGQAFHRGDRARQGSDHSGLGLALSRRLASLLGGDLSLQAIGGVFTANLILPPQPPARRRPPT